MQGKHKTDWGFVIYYASYMAGLIVIIGLFGMYVIGKLT